jgi:hypothetical protein
MTRTNRGPRILVLVFATLAFASAPARAACPDGPDRPNIILFMADDLGWSDLPFFSPEIAWPDDVATDNYHYRLWRPSLNRDAARLQQRFNSSGTPIPNQIVTIDAPVNAANPTPRRTPIAYENPTPGKGCGRSLATATPEACAPERDALEGFGGLRKLADGAAFSRFYASSAVCSPSRASILTGRHVTQHESKNVGMNIATHQVTIAEYLKQNCTDECWTKGGLSDCPCFHQSGTCPSGQCYTTGFIGKWHLGVSQEDGHVPWTQGFDEFVGYLGGNRGYFSEKALTCSPARSKYCSGTSNTCESDTECGGAPCEVRGLYVGPNPAADFNDADCGSQTAATDPECCEPTKFRRKGRYHVPGRKADRAHACNDNSGLARSPGVRRCIDTATGKVKGLCTLGGACPSGQSCAEGPVCEGGTKEASSCDDDFDCACHEGDPSDCKPGRCTVGCNFSERVYRDLAKDFISRHADDGRPFFLVVSFHAMHGGWKTTERTKAHYETTDPVTGKAVRPGQPYAGREFWGIMEEMDAAVGQIVDAAPENTFFLFVSDQGRPEGSYGSPVLIGGKRTMNEDGIRVGLLARACSVPEGGTNLDLGNVIGSQIDIFPTIADAAGLELSNFSPSAGATPVLRSCMGSGLGYPCGSGDEPVDHIMLGKSFYDAVNRDTPPATPVDGGSEFAFAKYGHGSAAVSKPGYYLTNTPAVTPSGTPTPLPSPFPGGVCGLAAPRNGRPQSDLIRAGSCETCDADGACSEKPCRVVGNVCVPKGGGHCVGGGSGTDGQGKCTQDADCKVGGVVKHCVFPLEQIGDRCGGCPESEEVCRAVSVDCGRCFLEASWKIKHSDGLISGFWDVATNPEEDARLDCQASAGGPEGNGIALGAIRDDLADRLSDFLNFHPEQ